MQKLARLTSLAAACVFVATVRSHAESQGQGSASGGPELQSAIEARFGKPDSAEQGDPTRLDYKLKNGDTIRFVLDGTDSARVEHRIDFARLVGERVTFKGTYGGPGKEADYIRIDGGSHIYFDLNSKKTKTKMSGIKGYGQSITAAGVVRFRSGSDSGDSAKASRSELYYLENAEVVAMER